MTEIKKQREVTLSYQELQEHLPESCYEAIVTNSSPYEFDENFKSKTMLMKHSEPPIPLTNEEKNQLFQEMGTRLITEHYTIDELREILSDHSLPPKKSRSLNNNDKCS